MGKNRNLLLSKPALISGINIIVMTFISIITFASLQVNTLSIIGIFSIIILDIVVAFGLYIFLKPANRTLAILMASLRIIYAGIFLFALIQIGNLDNFYFIWDRGLALFGFHLLVLGILLLKAKYVPKYLAYLVLLSSIGYIIDRMGKFIGYKTEITIFTFFGEIILGFWLVIKGRKTLLEK